MSDILDLDVARAAVPKTFAEVTAAVVVDGGQGVSRWALDRVGVAIEGVIRTASSLSANNLSTVFGNLAAAGDGDNPPDFFRTILAAANAGGSSSEVEERAKRDMCTQLAEFLWRCSEHGGMKVVDSHLVFPRLSFTTSGVSVDAGGPGPRGTDDDSLSVRSGPPAEPATTSKRPREDLQDLLSEMDAEESRGGLGSGGSTLASSSGATAKKAKSTYVTHTDKWHAKYTTLLSATSTLGQLKYMPEPQQLGHMMYIQQLIAELERLSRMDDSLSDGRKFILTLRAGVEHSMEHGQPLVAALWLQDKLKSESEEGEMVDRSAIVKELTTVGKFLSSDKLSGSKGSSWSGTGQPTMLAPHYGGMGGAAALGAITAFGGASAFGGFGGSPAGALGSAGFGLQSNPGARNQGRGGKGGKPARCNKCRNAGRTGQAIMHSFRNCPLTTCHKCGQNGHIERNCPN